MAFADDQLSASRREEVARYLAAHPEAAAAVVDIREQNRRLRLLFDAGSTPVPTALLPAAVRRRVTARRKRRSLYLASLLLTLGLGSGLGWQVRETQLQQAQVPMADAVEAYRLFASTAAAPPVDVSGREDAIQRWLQHTFVRAPALPNLERFGLLPVGGRLMASDTGPAAMVLYRDDQGRQVIFYLRHPHSQREIGQGSRQEGDVTADYWSGQGYNFALVSPSAAAFDSLREAIRPRAVF
ncbi:hypothetical protein [Pseudomonas sp. EpS/L25]|uniref:hypothetical protein n=1 Tax=Pseudomonas sp. EpS/L25 TaxID=1749078 RepID=UPI000743AA2D|nr:hypothetical protein [Pseudomonas sp. EpS/L25]KUM37893.1 hypothetical protein AR540_14065 [Pseudomonas sp. EpS/L25]